MIDEQRLRVGVDFGTTYSGVAWVDTADPDKVTVIKVWPGGSRSSVKVPSEITYDSAGNVHKWGYEIRPGKERLAWFKLLLEPTDHYSKKTGTLFRTSSLIPNQSAKRPVDVVADYLTCLRKHIIRTLKRTYGQAFLDVTPIDYILTVPAIWSDPAKELTLEAAVSAGFGKQVTLQLMSEPDAAAAWTLLRDIKQNGLKVGDAFVVVDCGGGTVDLISYEIESLEPLSLKECAAGTGELCGSTFINGNFEDLVRSRIGKQFDDMDTVPRNKMMKEFEEVLKPEFSNDEDQDWLDDEDDVFATCSIGGVADDLDARIQHGNFLITREEMLAIFDPVIDKIVPLVQKQIAIIEAQAQRGLNLSAVLLVGGFGASKYLFHRLENELKKGGGEGGVPLEILQTENAWSAVARGAALGIRITSRTARRNYGISCSTKFIHGKHPTNNLYISRHTGDARCSNVMSWFIEQGYQVSEEQPISIPFSRDFAIDGRRTFTDTLYVNEQESAPEYYSIVNHNVLCTLVSDLSMVPESFFIEKTGLCSVPYYHIKFNLVMTVKSAMIITFHLEIGGKKISAVTAKYRNAFVGH